MNSLNIATLGLLNRGQRPALSIASIGLLWFGDVASNAVASARPGFGAPEFDRPTNPEINRAAFENFKRVASPESERLAPQDEIRDVSHETIRAAPTTARRKNTQSGTVKRWH